MDITLATSDSLSKVKKGFYLVTKRLFDILVSLIGMVFLIPIYLVVKISYVLIVLIF